MVHLLGSMAPSWWLRESSLLACGARPCQPVVTQQRYALGSGSIVASFTLASLSGTMDSTARPSMSRKSPPQCRVGESRWPYAQMRTARSRCGPILCPRGQTRHKNALVHRTTWTSAKWRSFVTIDCVDTPSCWMTNYPGSRQRDQGARRRSRGPRLMLYWCIYSRLCHFLSRVSPRVAWSRGILHARERLDFPVWFSHTQPVIRCAASNLGYGTHVLCSPGGLSYAVYV